jgi:hypothetical protein
MADGTQGDTLYYGAAGAPTLLAKPGTPADEVLTFATGATAPSWVAAAGGLFESYSLLTDQKTASTTGGTFTSGAWRTRDLQTEVYDGIGITFSTNEFILPAGNYLIQWSAPGYRVDRHKTRLYDVTGTAAIQYGSSEASYTVSNGSDGMSRSFGSARVAPSGTNNYKIEHYCETTNSPDGFGRESAFSVVEIYTIVAIFKES